MDTQNIYQIIIQNELYGLYGQTVLEEMAEIIRLYDFYEKKGQVWNLPKDLNYIPTRVVTNYTKKLIKEEARFMFGRTPEIKIKPLDKKYEESSKQIEKFINKILDDNKFKDKLIKGARDCFIGKRTAIKLWGSRDEGIKIMFRLSLEFVYETDPEDTDKMTKIIFFYQTNTEVEKMKQRIWKQKYELINGRCILNEGVYDGYGRQIEEHYTDYNTGLDFIPAVVIINDGLTGDLSGESDVYELIDNQNIYNHLKSDDVDALKFNMFPQKVATDADGKSLKNAVIAPGALIDLQSEGLDEGMQAKMDILESKFSYDSRFENAINRVKNDMYELLNVPNVSLEQLKGLMQSGKSMKALYWGLKSRCEEKWCVWEPALIWMVESIIKMAQTYKIEMLPEAEYTIEIEHLYPIMEDEDEERKQDLEEVKNQARSRRGFIKKWGISEDSDSELKKIVEEQEMLTPQDNFNVAVTAESGAGVNGNQ